ncbi:MAG: hypothetical protein US76_01490 [Parcubacteria group bacterium GW2011_GWA2_38_13b]|nr:MAG: hypothetical protein US76_01490 [Parcubacteria group bacterium GW2011_GWA2_38_13b]
MGIIFFVLFIMGAAIVGRLFSLQVVNGGHYKQAAENQYKAREETENKRGEILIYDKNDFFPAAVNRKWPMVYVSPRDVSEQDRDRATEELAIILNLDKEVIRGKLEKKNDPYEPLAHRLSGNEAQKIKSLGIKGINVINEDVRYYPLGNVLAHVLGFVGFDTDKRVGQYGVEEFYEKDLKGIANQGVENSKDALRKFFQVIGEFVSFKKKSSDLILSIDRNIQLVAEDKLKQVMDKWSADSGNVIIMNPVSGEILAMANYPTFDLNEYFTMKDAGVFLNSSIRDLFEPGSVFKIITMAAALDSGKITPSTVYTDTGFVNMGGYTIKNWDKKSHGEQTMTQVLEKSLNTGVIFAESLLSKDDFLKYVRAFGFDKKTSIDLAGEVAGNISNLYFGRDINYATASFGQGIAVTPIELISAVSAIANQGIMVRPRVLSSFRDQDGKIIKAEIDKGERIISFAAARSLADMMVSVVDNGYDKAAKVSGYYVAGKTGTAQVPLKDEKNYGEETIHTFVGFAPAFNPRFAILLKINNPKGINFASNSLSPTFKQLTEFMLNYYGIKPDYEFEK